jgi:hypothetical protein
MYDERGAGIYVGGDDNDRRNALQRARCAELRVRSTLGFDSGAANSGNRLQTRRSRRPEGQLGREPVVADSGDDRATPSDRILSASTVQDGMIASRLWVKTKSGAPMPARGSSLCMFAPPAYAGSGPTCIGRLPRQR